MNQVPSEREYCGECDQGLAFLGRTWALCMKYHEFLEPYNFPKRLPICLKERPQIMKTHSKSVMRRLEAQIGKGGEDEKTAT